MIARIFVMTTFPGKEAELENKLRTISTQVFENQAGVSDYQIGRRIGTGNEREYALLSLWPDLGALREMTGNEWEKPHIPEAIAPLVESVTVSHYEVFANGPRR